MKYPDRNSCKYRDLLLLLIITIVIVRNNRNKTLVTAKLHCKKCKFTKCMDRTQGFTT